MGCSSTGCSWSGEPSASTGVGVVALLDTVDGIDERSDSSVRFDSDEGKEPTVSPPVAACTGSSSSST